MTTAALVDRLEKVKRTGPDRWLARCPAHDDRGPSLSVREVEDGRTLIHCFSGCSVHEIVAALGIDIADLFPPRTDAHAVKPSRSRTPAIDVLRALSFEADLVAICASRLGAGHAMDDETRTRLLVAAGRLGAALTFIQHA